MKLNIAKYKIYIKTIYVINIFCKNLNVLTFLFNEFLKVSKLEKLF